MPRYPDIDAANAALRAAKIPFTIECLGKKGKLNLRGMFPPKPGSIKTKMYQQRYKLEAYATPVGFEAAVLTAMRLTEEITFKRFTWPDDTSHRVEDNSLDKTLDKFLVYLQKDKNINVSSIQSYYIYPIKKLYGVKDLTLEKLVKIIKKNSREHTATRVRYCVVYSHLATFLGWDKTVIKPLRGDYSSVKSINPRTIPSDDILYDTWQTLEDKPLLWSCYGLMLLYGLRPHETLRYQSVKGQDYIRIEEETKTGSREVWPIPAKGWLEYFKSRPLADIPEFCTDRDNFKNSRFIRQKFLYSGLKNLYNVRHAYALRGMVYGVNDSLVAAWMGHSLAIHNVIYQRFLTQQHSKYAYAKLQNQLEQD